MDAGDMGPKWAPQFRQGIATLVKVVGVGGLAARGADGIREL